MYNPSQQNYQPMPNDPYQQQQYNQPPPYGGAPPPYGQPYGQPNGGYAPPPPANLGGLNKLMGVNAIYIKQ
jgi:hypothetical protein